MKRQIGWCIAAVCLAAGSANGGNLRMQWHGLGPNAREISLAPGEFATIDIYMSLFGGGTETLGEIAWSNEPVADLVQVAAAPGLVGWVNHSVVGILGGGSQQVAFSANEGFELVDGALNFLIGTQTIGLLSVGDGAAMEVTFDLDSLVVLTADGLPLPRVSTPPKFGPSFGWYFIGAGSPGYTDGWGTNWRDPLIVNPIPEPGSLALLALGAAAILGRHRR